MIDPSIHILLSDLTLILKKANVKNYEKVALKIFTEGSKVTLKHRLNININTKDANKVKNILANDVDQRVALFQTALLQSRGSIYTEQILKGTSKYNLLVEIAGKAFVFYETFNFDKEIDAYLAFCETGLKLIGKKYALNKFKSKYDQIFQTYEYRVEIESDPNINNTFQFFKIYAKEIYSRMSLKVSIEKGDYFRLIDYHLGRKIADKLKADYQDYIDAQFEGLAYLGVAPERYNLHSEGAKERYLKYMKDKFVKNKNIKNNQYSDYLNKV